MYWATFLGDTFHKLIWSPWSDAIKRRRLFTRKSNSAGMIYECGRFLPASILLQGCQMVYFLTKNPNSGTLWRALEWKMFFYFIIIWNISWPFGTIYAVWYSLWSFGIFFLFWYVWNKKYLATLQSS
jgi:hypothetical protein